jgi:HEAT repeat protein
VSSTVVATQVALLVRSLALAWKNLSAYPPGHPALVGSVDQAHQRLAELRGPGGEVVLGISHDGLVYGKDKVLSAHAQKFAQALYTRGVALIRFHPNVTPSDLETFLRLMGGGTPGSHPRPLWEELTEAGIVTIHLQPVDYSGVQVSDDLTAPPPPKHEASLWDEILRALVGGRELSADGQQLLRTEVRSVNDLASIMLEYVKTISKLPQADFDPDATFGIRFSTPVPETPEIISARVAESVGLHITRSTGLRKQVAVQQVVQLLRTLPEPMRGTVLRAVLRALSTDESNASLLRDFASSFPDDEILEMLRYLSTMTKLSPSAGLLLQSMVRTAAPVPAVSTDAAVPIGELVKLFGDEDVDRFNPEDHQALLSEVSIQMPEVKPGLQPIDLLGDRVETVTDEAVSLQLSLSVLALLERYGSARAPDLLLERTESLFRSHLTSGQYAHALSMILELREIAQSGRSEELRKKTSATVTALASEETIRALVQSLHTERTEGAEVIQRLIEAMGATATRSLLLALAEENNRSRRRRLFDFVASLGSVIVPEATKFLADERWYVVRNMVVLLRAVNDRTSLPEIRRNARHPDMRVRLEAIKTLLSFDSSVPRGLLEEAIHDPDSKMAEMAISLVGNYGIKEGIDLLIELLAGRDVFGKRRPLRIRAIKALGELAEPAVLPRMEHLFQESVLPWPSREERRAAYESLAGYPSEARLAFVERGMRSRDSQIRDICRRLVIPTPQGERQ